MEETLLWEDVQLEELIETEKKVSKGVKLIVHNDDYNTFDWVIEALMDICDHTEIQAEQCTLLIHYKGVACVKSGKRSNIKPMKEGLIDKGINATIEN